MAEHVIAATPTCDSPKRDASPLLSTNDLGAGVECRALPSR